METRDGWAGVAHGKPTVGQRAERSRRTSTRDIEAFTEITGDRNPVHYDDAIAAASPWGGLIVQGGVTSGLLNACVAEDVPGPGTVFLEVNWRFVKAVGIDTDITGIVEVTSVRDDKPICQLATSVVDGSGDLCLEGTATTYTVPILES